MRESPKSRVGRGLTPAAIYPIQTEACVGRDDLGAPQEMVIIRQRLRRIREALRIRQER